MKKTVLTIGLLATVSGAFYLSGLGGLSEKTSDLSYQDTDKKPQQKPTYDQTNISDYPETNADSFKEIPSASPLAYWKSVKEKYGEDFDLIRSDIISGVLDGLKIFETVAVDGTVEDKTWFIDIVREHSDSQLFMDILRSPCCDDLDDSPPNENFGNLVFSFAIDQFNRSPAYALMDYYEEIQSPEKKMRALYLLGNSSQYSAGDALNAMVVDWLENKMFAQSGTDDIAIVMAYFRASQGNPEKSSRAEKYLAPLLTQDNALLTSDINLDYYLGLTTAGQPLINALGTLLKNKNLSEETYDSLSGIYEFWTSQNDIQQ